MGKESLMVATLVGMQVAGQIMGSIMGGYAQAEQYARQDMAFQQQEFQRQLEVDNQNYIINQQNANRLIRNRTIATSGAKQLESQLQQNLEGMQGSLRALTNAAADADAKLKSGMQGKNIAGGVGTAAALMRMSIANRRRSFRNLEQQKMIADQNARNQYQNLLNQRDMNMQANTHFIAGVSPAGDPGSAITAGWIGAAGSAAGAYFGSKAE